MPKTLVFYPSLETKLEIETTLAETTSNEVITSSVVYHSDPTTTPYTIEKPKKQLWEEEKVKVATFPFREEMVRQINK